jgi:DNA-binding XRE family transcriptional regulator
MTSTSSVGWPASGRCAVSAGAFFITATAYHNLPRDATKYAKIFRVCYGPVEVDVEKLKELRIDQGLTQSELARQAGITHGAVWNIEHRGRGRPDTLKKIADVLGVRASQLARER